MDLFFLTVDNVVMRKTSVSVFPIKERYFFDNLEGVPGGTDRRLESGVHDGDSIFYFPGA